MRRGATPQRSLSRILLALPVLASCAERPIDRARADLEAGRLDAAGETFLAIARADPAHLAAWDGAVEVWCERRVHVARCLEVLDLELERLGSIRRHHDALAVSLEKRATARLDAGLARAALADLERAERVAPERAEAPLLAVRAHAMLGDRAAALAALERAAALAPDHAGLADARRRIPAPPAELEAGEPGFGGPR